MRKISVIINPASAAGRTGRQVGKISSLINDRLGSPPSILITAAPGEATMLAKNSALEGADVIIAVGGDGTINEVVNGIFEGGRPVRPGLRLGIIASGTSSGLAQSLNFPKSIGDQAGIIRDGNVRMIDLGKIRYTGIGSSAAERYFVNECQIGIGGTIVKKVAQAHKAFGGRIAFGWVTLIETVRDHPKKIDVSIDGGGPETLSIHGLTAANGVYMGGGMKLAPGALLDDGLLDLLFIHEQGLLRRFKSYSKIYSGGHVGLKGFSYLNCSNITLSSDDLVYVGSDGELLGTLPCKIEILPKTLAVYAPA